MGASYQRAAELFDARRHDLAETLLRRDLAAEPNDPWSLALLSLCLHRRKRTREAIDRAREAIRQAPALAFAHYALAAAHCGRGGRGRKEARAALEEAIRLDPQVAEYFFLLAAVQYDLGQPRRALKLAEAGLALDPGHVRCANIRALALKQCGRAAEALPTLDRALARDPESDYTHTNRGWLLFAGRDFAGADAHFREALRLNPENLHARRGWQAVGGALRPVGLLVDLNLRLNTFRRIDGDDPAVRVRPRRAVGPALLLLQAATVAVLGGAIEPTLVLTVSALLVAAAALAHRHSTTRTHLLTFGLLAAFSFFYVLFGAVVGLLVTERPSPGVGPLPRPLLELAQAVAVVGLTLFLWGVAAPPALADLAARRLLERRESRRRRRARLAGGA